MSLRREMIICMGIVNLLVPPITWYLLPEYPLPLHFFPVVSGVLTLKVFIIYLLTAWSRGERL